mmetsp:Transcript_83230/g.165233  ORF Transcript_83230/g.165233 Transcript_83230/m.165233 type:complete len:541 (-) Transcript_83230:307-1929(-)
MEKLRGQQHLIQANGKDSKQLAIGKDSELRDAVISAAVDQPENAILVLDPLQPHSPIVAVSDSFCKMLGAPQSALVGKTFSGLLRDLPKWNVSRSAGENFASFCSVCSQHEVCNVGEACIMQTLADSNGELFMGHLAFGLCVARGLRFVVGLLQKAGDVTTRLSGAKQVELTEQARDIFACVSAQVEQVARQYLGATKEEHLDDCCCCCKATDADLEGIAFFGSRLPEYAVLRQGGRTAGRREPDQVASGCLVLGSQPVRRTLHGLSFALQVDGVSSRFRGLPYIGVTRVRPTTGMQYPRVAKCLAESVLIGGSGEASARDQVSHFKMGFRAPPQSEIMTWSSKLPEDLTLHTGDILECNYTLEGHMQLLINSTMVLDFNVDRPPDMHASYYPVVDVSGAASVLSLLPDWEFSTLGDLSTYMPDEWDLGEIDVADVGSQVSGDSMLCSFGEDLWSSVAKLEAGTCTSAEVEEGSGAVRGIRLGPYAIRAPGKVIPIAGLAGILVTGGVGGSWRDCMLACKRPRADITQVRDTRSLNNGDV